MCRQKIDSGTPPGPPQEGSRLHENTISTSYTRALRGSLLEPFWTRFGTRILYYTHFGIPLGAFRVILGTMLGPEGSTITLLILLCSPLGAFWVPLGAFWVLQAPSWLLQAGGLRPPAPPISSRPLSRPPKTAISQKKTISQKTAISQKKSNISQNNNNLKGGGGVLKSASGQGF